MPDVLIWWLSQNVCRRIGEPCEEEESAELGPRDRPPCVRLGDLPLPAYLREQYRSRYGRPGRGRLWVDDQFGDVAITPWPGQKPAAQAAEECGGIVFDRSDLPEVLSMPGFVTDLALNVVACPDAAHGRAPGTGAGMSEKGAHAERIVELTADVMHGLMRGDYQAADTAKSDRWFMRRDQLLAELRDYRDGNHGPRAGEGRRR